MAEALRGMMGAGLTAVPAIGVGTALTIAAEVGPDMSAFPSERHPAPGWGWRREPGSAAESPCRGARPGPAAGSRRPRPWPPCPPAGARRPSAPGTAPASPGRTRRWRSPATARGIACLVYTPVTNGEEHLERGMDAYGRRRVNRTVTNLGRRARQLGYQLVRIPESPESGNTLESVG